MSDREKKIFISYGSGDSDIVNSIIKALKEYANDNSIGEIIYEFEVEPPSDDWLKDIILTINSSKALLVFSN